MTCMESMSQATDANSIRPLDTDVGGVTDKMGGLSGAAARSDLANSEIDVDRPRKVETDEFEVAGPNRRGFLAGGLVASAASLVGRRAVASGGGGAGSVYRIHPSIGIARLGNAPSSTFYIGPEVPGLPPLGDAPGTTVPPYKVNGQIKPQAVRFRIFEYQWINGTLTPVREVTLDTPGVVGISWSAHLANKKASFNRFRGPLGEKEAPGPVRNVSVADRRSLEIDFGARSIAGRSLGPVEFRTGTSGNPSQEACPLNSSGQPVIDYLGELRTDDEGRLVVIGGKGKAACSVSPAPALVSYANNDNWYDDVSDGPVTAVVKVDDGNGGTVDVPVDDAGGAWLLVGPPDFAPGIYPAVTLYDLLYDLAVRELPIPLDSALYQLGGPLYRLNVLAADYQPLGPVEFPTYVPIYEEEIKHIFTRAFEHRWVTALVSNKHASLLSPTLAIPGPQYAKTRQAFFASMRAPTGSGKSTGSMPRHLGDDPYNGNAPDDVRRLAITRTHYGILRNWAAGQFVSDPPPPQPVVITPHGLDKAQLDKASGGAFFPGIETGWQIRNAALFIEPFRIDLQAMSQYWGETLAIGPGHFSRQLALPWQADFTECANEGQYAWWPAQRPDDVYTSPNANRPVRWIRPTTTYSNGKNEPPYEDMVAAWHKYGIVVEQGGAWVETERAAQIP